MTRIRRREFVLSAAAAAVVFGLDRKVAILPSAFAEEAAPPFHKFTVGDVDVVTVYDGIWEKPHDPNFGRNVSLDEIKQALVAGGRTEAHVPIPFTMTVVKFGGKTIMFDSSTGGQVPAAGQGKAGFAFAGNLRAAGIELDKVDAVIVTHFHPDHIFGLMAAGTDAQIFPNAEIIVPAEELKFWTDEARTGALSAQAQGLAKRIRGTLGVWKNVRPAEAGAEVVPGIVALPTFGHTPGHTSYALAQGKLIVAGDLTNIPPLNMRHPGWRLAVDLNGDAAEAVRRKTFDRAIADGITMTGYHWGMPGAGKIVRDGDGYALVPVA